MRLFTLIAVTAAAGLGAPTVARAAATASFTPSRANGVAPLAVYFDASASACEGCEGVVHAWHDLAYAWDFGDPEAGTWAVTGRSRGRDIGPLAAHVFERPGVYTVALTVTDPVSGQTATTMQEITVDDPDQVFAGDATRCYRASDVGDFAGCPAGALQQTLAGFDAVIADCKGEGRRCLLRRGDTFTASGTVQLGADAPAMIGAFGRGARPVVDASGLGGSSLLSGAQGGDDYRIVDLAFAGPGVKGSRIFGARQPQRDVLFLRVESVGHSWHNFIDAEQTQLMVKGWHERMFVVDSAVQKAGFGAGGNIAFFTFKQSALLGNEFIDTLDGEHTIRAGAYDGLVIAHNRLGPADTIRSVITLRSADADVPCAGGVCAPSRKALLLDNVLHITNGWTVQVCGQAMQQNNQCEDTIVDGNFASLNPAYTMTAKPNVVFNLADQTTRRTSFRNNICDLTNGLAGALFHCADLKVGSLARALNNTCFRADADKLVCINTYGAQTPDGVSTIARNNLAYSSGGGAVDVVAGGWQIVENNLEAADNPFAAAMPGDAALDFLPAEGSPAIDGGAPTANLFDHAGRRRPAGAGYDIGAWEFGAADVPLAVELAAAQNPVGIAAAFTLTASAAGGAGAPTFAWDCDGDGSFEQDSGPAAMIECPGLAAGSYTVAVRASDDSGTATDSLELVVREACGNGVIDGGELCDGADLGGETCASQGFAGGALACLGCTAFDTRACTDGGTTGGGTGGGTGGSDLPTTGSLSGETGASGGSTGESDSGGAAAGDAGCGCRSPGGAAGLAWLLLLGARRRASGR